MAETLGSLCDKLTIVRLKQWHTTKPERLKSLARQMEALQEEIDEFVSDAVAGKIPATRLKFAANKVYREKAHVLGEIAGGFGSMVSKLAEVNCALWHQQEKVYDFENIPAREKNGVIKRLALLNLERNQCMEKIDEIFSKQLADRCAGSLQKGAGGASGTRGRRGGAPRALPATGRRSYARRA